MQEKLILLMKRKGITYKELANKINISEKQMGLKIRGQADFKSTEMFTIAQYFNLPIDEIFLPIMYENGTSNDKNNKKKEE